jgi:hydrogenase nickel incorporation protein HypA/HybF
MLMHEAMVAQSLLAAISAEAEKHKARPLGAKISCGQLYAINDEVLYFAFEALAKGTTCEGARLEIEHKSLRASCKQCGSVFEIDIGGTTCANCRSQEFELLADAPLLLEEIEFENGVT